MTELIDLSLLQFLYNEAQHNRHEAVRQCLTYPPYGRDIAPEGTKKMSDSLFTHLTLTYVQAEIVYKNLERLHIVCTDFAAGMFQPYIDRNRQYQQEHVPEPDRGTYTPDVELEIPFNIAFDFPLPQTIGQFPQLLGLCQNFNKVRTLKREGLNPVFGDEPFFYEYTNDQGETEIVHPSELPKDVLSERVAQQTSINVAVEKSLEYYNEFYSLSRDYLESYQENSNAGDAELRAVAAKILALYK